MNDKFISVEGKQGRTIIVRLKPGQDIVEGITKILIEKKIKAGYIPILIGGFRKLKLISSAFGENENHPNDVKLEYKEPLEFVGQGTIAQTEDGKPSVHIHLSAGQAGNKSITGHLVSGEILYVAEIVIVEVKNVSMIRKPDPEVYYKPLLDFC